jgi:predicted transcriptional regulator
MEAQSNPSKKPKPVKATVSITTEDVSFAGMSGPALKAFRLDMKLTQPQLAALMGYNWKHISDMETGHRGIPGYFIRHLLTLRELLDLRQSLQPR